MKSATCRSAPRCLDESAHVLTNKMQLPADQTEHVYVAARLNSTYGSLTFYTTPVEKSCVQECNATDTGNVKGYAAYYDRKAEQDIRLAQRLSVRMRYISTSDITTTDIHTLINNQRTADLVQLNDAFGWPDYKYLPIAQRCRTRYRRGYRSTSIPLKCICCCAALCMTVT